MREGSKGNKRRVITILEVLILIILGTIEYFTSYSPGLMRHLYYIKAEYLSSLYNYGSINMHGTVILVILLIAFLIIMIRRKNYENKGVGMLIVYSIVLYISLYIPVVKNVNTYPYLIMVLESFIFIEVAWILIPSKK